MKPSPAWWRINAQLKAANMNNPTPDYGFDPHEQDASGKVISWRLVPSGRVVDRAGLDAFRANRTKRTPPVNDCLGLSWDEIERQQGGRLNRNA